MRRLAGVLVLALMACSGEGGNGPFDALGADPDAVPAYEVIVEDPQTPERRWVELEVDSWAEGAAEAAAADYLADADPGEDETVVKVSFTEEPWRGCTLFWPDDDRNDEGCP